MPRQLLRPQHLVRQDLEAVPWQSSVAGTWAGSEGVVAVWAA